MTTNLSRRTLAKSAAWTAPAIAVATAAPTFAASLDVPVPSSCLTIKMASTACRWTGAGKNWAYHLVIQVCNGCATGELDLSDAVTKSIANNAGKPLISCDGTGSQAGLGTDTVKPNSCSGPIDLGNFRSSSSARRIVFTLTVGGKDYDYEVDAPGSECNGLTNTCI